MAETPETKDIKSNNKQFALLLKSPVTKSLALHGAILLSLLVSFNFSEKPLLFAENMMSAPAQPVEIVNATFIDSNVIQQKQREKAQAEAAAKQRAREQQRKEAERKETLRKKKVAAERKKREAEEKAKQEEQAKQDKLKLEQQKEQAIAQQRAKEAEDKAKQAELQRMLEQEMQEQLAQEQTAMSQANQRRITSEAEKYQAQIRAKVQQYMNNDGAYIGESCAVRVRLAPDGLVLDVTAISGNGGLCRITEAAVIKAGTLPVPRDPEVFAQFRDFTIIFSPEK